MRLPRVAASECAVVRLAVNENEDEGHRNSKRIWLRYGKDANESTESKPARPTTRTMFGLFSPRSTVPSGRSFSAAAAKGGCELAAAKTALVCIEFQNEFATEGGKLHGAVKDVMAETQVRATALKSVRLSTHSFPTVD